MFRIVCFVCSLESLLATFEHELKPITIYARTCQPANLTKNIKMIGLLSYYSTRFS